LCAFILLLLIIKLKSYIPTGKIAEKAACRSVFLKIWHCILSAESDCFYGDFAHWDSSDLKAFSKSNPQKVILNFSIFPIIFK